MPLPDLLLRKSGSWHTYHSDSAIVKRDDRSYIIVALSNDADGKQWMTDLAVAMDKIISSGSKRRWWMWWRRGGDSR